MFHLVDTWLSAASFLSLQKGVLLNFLKRRLASWKVKISVVCYDIIEFILWSVLVWISAQMLVLPLCQWACPDWREEYSVNSTEADGSPDLSCIFNCGDGMHV